jgi:hypothetical protein
MTLPRGGQRSTKSLLKITASACRAKDRETFLVIGLGEGPAVQYRLRTPQLYPYPPYKSPWNLLYAMGSIPLPIMCAFFGIYASRSWVSCIRDPLLISLTPYLCSPSLTDYALRR